MYNLVGEELILKAVLNCMSLVQRADQIFKKMDKDEDEQVTAKEFTIAAEKDPSLSMLLVGRSSKARFILFRKIVHRSS